MPKLFIVSAVVMCLSYTLTKERLFAPMREWLGGKETFVGYLFSCPYCVSHWLAFAIVPLTRAYYVDVAPGLGVLGAFLRWFLSCILVVAIASFLRVLFFFVDETQGLVKRAQKKVDVETKQVERAVRPSRPSHA